MIFMFKFQFFINCILKRCIEYKGNIIWHHVLWEGEELFRVNYEELCFKHQLYFLFFIFLELSLFFALDFQDIEINTDITKTSTLFLFFFFLKHVPHFVSIALQQYSIIA